MAKVRGGHAVLWAPVAAAVWLTALTACTDRWLDPPPDPAAVLQCPRGTVLDTTAGICIPAACSSSDDCPAGRSCDLNTGSCVLPAPVDPVEPSPGCSVGTARCTAGGEREICDVDGWLAWSCREGTSCHDGNCIACLPDERRCAADGSAAYEFCTGDGSGWIAVTCLDHGATCVDGFCRVCTPGETRCNGGGVAVCDPTGSRWNTVECGAGNRCEVLGDGATCVPMACTPTSSTCDPLDARQRIVCRDDGSGVTAVPCPSGSECRMPQGQCLDECGLAALEGRGAGCEYWFTHLPNGAAWTEISRNLVLRLTNPGTDDAELRIDSTHTGTPVFEGVSLQPGVAQDFPLPWRALTGSHLANGAFHLESSRPVIAQLISRVDSPEASGSATTLLPQHLLATDGQGGSTYVTWSPRHQSTDGLDDPALLTVVGTRANTHVEVEFGADTAASTNGEMQAWNRGERTVFELGAGDVLQFATRDSGDSEEADGRKEWFNDFSGTWLRSDGPIAVFAGADQSSLPLEAEPDHLEEQLPPLSLWARRYVGMPRSEADRFTLLAGENGALVLFNRPVVDLEGDGSQVQTLPPRGTFRFVADGPFEIRSNEGVLLVQQTGSEGELGATGAVVVPPLDRGRRRYWLHVPTDVGSEIHLIAPRVGASGSAPQVTIAGFTVDGWTPLDGTELQTARVPLCKEAKLCSAEGAYQVVASDPVLLVVHEGGDGGLSYVGGFGDAPSVSRPNPY